MIRQTRPSIIGFLVEGLYYQAAAGHDLHHEPAAAQQGHADQRTAVGLIDWDGAAETVPEDPSVVDSQGGSVAVGQLDLDEAAPGQGQRPDYPGRERQVACEAGVHYGLDLGGFATTPPAVAPRWFTGRAEYPQHDHGLTATGGDVPAQAPLYGRGAPTPMR